jgi:hypothetical protein
MATTLPKSKRAPMDKTALPIRQPNTAGYMAVVQTMGTMGGLDPQECFNKALETVAALKPTTEAKTYTTAKLQWLRAACSLTVAEMDTVLPPIHARLLAEGCTKCGTEAVLAQALRPTEDSDNPGLIYVLPELVQDIMGCKYGLGWDTSYSNCHRGLSPVAVPHMSLKHQQERLLYQDRLRKASMTTVWDVEKGEESLSSSPKSYRGCLQLLLNYIKLLLEVIGIRITHLLEVMAIHRKLGQKVDLYISMGPRDIRFLLCVIFLDAWEIFLQQVKDTKAAPEPQLKYTTSFLGVGPIPMPVAQFGASSSTTMTPKYSSLSSGTDMFKPADFVSPKTSSVPDDISLITGPLMDKFPNATTGARMTHGQLNFEDIGVGNKGACLKYNLLNVCANPKCSYRHAKAKPTAERVWAVVNMLKPAVEA